MGAYQMCRSYIEKEEKRRADLGIDVATTPLGLTENSELVQKGDTLSWKLEYNLSEMALAGFFVRL